MIKSPVIIKLTEAGGLGFFVCIKTLNRFLVKDSEVELNQLCAGLSCE